MLNDAIEEPGKDLPVCDFFSGEKMCYYCSNNILQYIIKLKSVQTPPLGE